MKKKSATCVFRKVTLLELLLWGQTVWGIQRLYILFIVCVCAYSPVWCSLDPEVSVDAMWSAVGNPEVENRLRQRRPWVCGDVSAWLGVCRSLVHWTLPLHRVLLFSWFFLPLFDNKFWISWIQLRSWQYPVLTSVDCCSCDHFLLLLFYWSIFSSCTLFCCYSCYCQCVLFFKVSHSVPVLSLPNSNLSFCSLFFTVWFQLWFIELVPIFLFWSNV